MKRISVFLISQNEREENEFLLLRDYVAGLNRELEHDYHVFLDLLTLDNADAPTWQLQETLEEIRASDIVFLLLNTSTGDVLRRCFNEAYRQFSAEGKPAIYTYIHKDAQNINCEATAFLNELYRDTGHYWSIYEHIDTIKLKLLSALKLNVLSAAEMTIQDGILTVDKKPLLALKNVPMYAANQQLAVLRAELAAAEQAYYAQKAEYAKPEHTQAVCKSFAEAAAKRQTLADQLADAEKNLFEVSLNMTETAARGPLTPRQKEAYRLFDAGDAESANAILDAEEMKRDFRAKMEQRRREDQQLSTVYIRELATKIEILKTMTAFPGRFNEILSAYDEITEISLQYGAERQMIVDYLFFLSSQNNIQQAIRVGTRFLTYLSESGLPDIQTALFYLLLGNVYIQTAEEHEKGYSFLTTAISVLEKLLPKREDQRIYEFYIEAVRLLGNYCILHARMDEAKRFLTRGEAILHEMEALFPEGSVHISEAVLSFYLYAGIFFENNDGNPAVALPYYEYAAAIAEKIYQPDRIQLLIPVTYLALARIHGDDDYAEQYDMLAANRYITGAIEICEHWYEISPQETGLLLAQCYALTSSVFLGDVRPYLEKIRETGDHSRQWLLGSDLYPDDIERKERYMKQAVNLIELYAFTADNSFFSNKVIILMNAADFFVEMDDPEQAEEILQKAIRILEPKALMDPVLFTRFLCNCYVRLGLLKEEEEDTASALLYYEKLLSVIAEQYKTVPETCESFLEGIPDLFKDADFTADYDDYFPKTENEAFAEKYFQTAIGLYRDLSDADFITYGIKLIGVCLGAAVYPRPAERSQTAEAYINNLTQTLRRTQAERDSCFQPPEKAAEKRFAWADLYREIGSFLIKTGNIDDAKRYLLQAINVLEPVFSNGEEIRNGLPVSFSYFISIYCGIGRLFADARLPEPAEQCYRKAVYIGTAFFSAKTKESLSVTYAAWGRLKNEQAGALFGKSIALANELLAEDKAAGWLGEPIYTLSYIDAADYFAFRGDHRSAERCYKTALHIILRHMLQNLAADETFTVPHFADTVLRLYRSLLELYEKNGSEEKLESFKRNAAEAAYLTENYEGMPIDEQYKAWSNRLHDTV